MASLRGVSCEPAIRPASRGRSLVLPASLTPPKRGLSLAVLDRPEVPPPPLPQRGVVPSGGGGNAGRSYYSIVLLPSFFPHFLSLVRCCQLKGGSFLPPPAPRKSREERLGDVSEPLFSALRSCVVCYSLWSWSMFGEVRIRKVARERMGMHCLSVEAGKGGSDHHS